MKPQTGAEWMTPAEVARKLKVSAETIRSECRKGRLIASRVGSQFRIMPADLAEYLIVNRTGPGKEVKPKAAGDERDGSSPDLPCAAH